MSRHFSIPAEARLKKAKEEEVSRPGLRRTSSFVMAAKTTNMLQQYESQVLVVLVRTRL